MSIVNSIRDDDECRIICGKDIILSSEGRIPKACELNNICDEDYIEDSFTEINNKLSVVSLKPEAVIKNGYKSEYLRVYFSKNCDEDVFMASRAKALISWRKETVFCPHCGSELLDSKVETARECPECGRIHFPKIEPCIIMRITNGNSILLAKHAKRNQDVFACVAGFVEAGETLEQACFREVLEETGIKIKNIRYCGSQSWPFPSQLMCAFSAEYESGEIKVQEDEISQAEWFDKDNLPITPPVGSIAYKLIHFEI